jgi:hypothetical protein
LGAIRNVSRQNLDLERYLDLERFRAS